MLTELTEIWRIHESINMELLGNIPEAAFGAIPLLKDGKPGRGRDIARVFGHIYDVRMSAMRKAEKDEMTEVPVFDKGYSPTRLELEKALIESSVAVVARLRNALTAGDVIRKRHPSVWLAYLISHESHHRGQLMLAMKQNGYTLSDPLKWGPWERWFKD
ncbi:DinB family protein [bacterium]|nr:DinB family protein [bacterium]